MKIVVLFSNGTEEIESLTVVDVLRRAGVNCEIVSISGKNPVGSHKIGITADRVIEDISAEEYDGVIVPGGMPGSENISKNKPAIELIKTMKEKGNLVGAICAAPAVVLARHGFANGKRITCYPSDNFKSQLSSAVYTGADVEVDGNIITADGIKSAMKFAITICDYLGVKPKF